MQAFLYVCGRERGGGTCASIKGQQLKAARGVTHIFEREREIKRESVCVRERERRERGEREGERAFVRTCARDKAREKLMHSLSLSLSLCVCMCV